MAVAGALASRSRWGFRGSRLTPLLLVSLASLSAVSGCWSRGHPEPNPVRGYQLELSRPDGVPRSVTIGAQGEGCEVLLPNADANRTCLIATNVIASIIGGEAYGELNAGHTPALDALIWRARADGDVSVCERGGLEGSFRDLCERAAEAGDYEYDSGDVRVRVPIGGAEPDATTSTG